MRFLNSVSEILLRGVALYYKGDIPESGNEGDRDGMSDCGNDMVC